MTDDAPRPIRDDRALARLLAWASLACLVAMIAVTAVTGVSQEEFEVVAPAPAFGARLVAGLPALRALMALDCLFLCAYAAFFVAFLGAHRDGRPPLVAWLGLGALLATAALDLVEDHHILALATAAAAGDAPSPAAIVWQQAESQVKFGLSALGLLLYGAGLPRRDALERGFAVALAVPMPLISAAIWAAPPALVPPLVLARVALFVGGFAGALVILGRRAPAAPAA